MRLLLEFFSYMLLLAFGASNFSKVIGWKDQIPKGPPPFQRHKLTGFVASAQKSEVYGRPVGVSVLSDGSLLVTDDGSNLLWRVTYSK